MSALEIVHRANSVDWPASQQLRVDALVIKYPMQEESDPMSRHYLTALGSMILHPLLT